MYTEPKPHLTRLLTRPSHNPDSSTYVACRSSFPTSPSTSSTTSNDSLFDDVPESEGSEREEELEEGTVEEADRKGYAQDWHELLAGIRRRMILRERDVLAGGYDDEILEEDASFYHEDVEEEERMPEMEQRQGGFNVAFEGYEAFACDVAPSLPATTTTENEKHMQAGAAMARDDRAFKGVMCLALASWVP